MLERPVPAIVQKTWRESDAPQDFISLSDIVFFFGQYRFSILAFSVAGILFATFYIATADPIYTARTQILIEPKIPRNLQQQPAEVNLSLDTAQVESQLAVLRSQKIAMMVIDDLGLMDNPTFREMHGPTLGERLRRAWTSIAQAGHLNNHSSYVALATRFDRLLTWLHQKQPTSQQRSFERERSAVEIFDDGLDVQRVGVSYAIDITFQSLEPALAARIANATADAFVREQVQTTTAAANEGVAWLERRMREVGDQMNQATRAAQEFRAKHDYSIDPNETPIGRQDFPLPGNEQQTTLEQLEVTADTYRKMYESLLGAYTNSVDQQPYLIADARVITSATSPMTESWPRKKLILAFGALAGLVVGIGFAVSRRSLDRKVRRSHQIRRELGLDCIGELPQVSFRRGGFGRLDEVLKDPGSSFSASLKSAKAVISLAGASRQVRSIGITSVSPGDGKSTVVSNLAALFGASGITTLVIIADHKSALASELLSSPDFDVIDQEAADPKELVKKIQFIERMSFYGLKSVEGVSNNLNVADNVEKILKEDDLYKMVIVELPPFTSGVDALAVCQLLDGVIVVAQWGETSLDQLADLTQTLRNTNSSILGVLMTRVRSVSARGYRKRAAEAPR